MSVTQANPSPADEYLSGLELPKGANWANSVREAALARVQETGLPTRRDEYWKYTNPSALVAIDAADVSPIDVQNEVEFENIDRLNIVFIDGVFDVASSDDLSMSDVTIERLTDVMNNDIHWVSSLYSKLEQNGQSPISRPLAALNSAIASDGIVIRVSGKAPKPVSITYRQVSATSDVVLHHVVKVEEGAEFTLLENGPAAARLNTVLEVDVADGGSFNHIRTQGLNPKRIAVTHMFARLGSNSAFKSFTLTANGTLVRNEAILELIGDDTIAHVAGAALGDGDGNDFHQDDTVFITHDALNCESRQVYKKVLRNGATGVFQGKILVKAGAQKTDGYQISQALLLDDDSQFLAKPELEIYADDVACSHGSTTGAIDEEALFYLRSRGVPTKEAQDLLVLAFLAESVQEIENGDIAENILGRLTDWLGRRAD